jgi:hypothetical protein
MNNVWIVKPGEDTNRGSGIIVTKDFNEIKNLVRDMNGREPRGYGSSAFIVPNSHGRLRGTVLVLGFDGGDLFPYMNRDYGDKTKYHAMQDLLRRMGYGWEYATRDRREANVYKLFTDENGPILSGEGNR